MESRMNKYYKENENILQRSKKNENLYKEIYNGIDDLDNLPIPDNSNEIDVNGFNKIISSREEYHKNKSLANTFTREKKLVHKEDIPKKEERKVYDINVLLENAKNEIDRSEKVKEKEINNNFLTGLKDAEIPDNNDAIELAEEVPSEKKISNTDSLPLDILVDLKGKDNTIVTDPIVKDEVTMIKKIKEGETFYSGSFNFSKKDFEEDDDDNNFMEEKSHNGIKIFFLIFGLLLLAGAIYFILTEYVLS